MPRVSVDFWVEGRVERKLRLLDSSSDLSKGNIRSTDLGTNLQCFLGHLDQLPSGSIHIRQANRLRIIAVIRMAR